MSARLTEKALANLEAGATSGAGTYVCRKCDGKKEETRLNSNVCRACQPAKVLTKHKMTVTVSAEVYAALSAEAARHGILPDERVTYLLTRKYTARPDQTV